MVSGIDKIIYLPVTLGDRLGYFSEQNLDVEILSEPVGGEAQDELLTGTVDGVVGFYDHTIDLQAKGKFVESIVVFGQTPGEAELVSSTLASQIRSPADFKGRRQGVTGLGSSTEFLTRYLAVKHGVAVRDLTLVPVGAGNTFIAAMQEGRIDVGMTTEPTISRMLKTGGAHVLVDLRGLETTRDALGGTYPAACLYIQSAWAERHRKVAQRLTNAFVKTLRFINTHSAAQIAEILPSTFYGGDKADYVQALDQSKALFTADGRMPLDGPPTVLAVLSGVTPTLSNKTIDLSKTYTDEFVDTAR